MRKGTKMALKPRVESEFYYDLSSFLPLLLVSKGCSYYPSVARILAKSLYLYNRIQNFLYIYIE